jgi:ABC-type transport system substrate-binding protein
VTVTAVDDATVRMELSNPIGGFLPPRRPADRSAHLLEGIGGPAPTSPFGQQPTGSGPYRLVSWNAGEASLEAFVRALERGAGC